MHGKNTRGRKGKLKAVGSEYKPRNLLHNCHLTSLSRCCILDPVAAYFNQTEQGSLCRTVVRAKETREERNAKLDSGERGQ